MKLTLVEKKLCKRELWSGKYLKCSILLNSEIRLNKLELGGGSDPRQKNRKCNSNYFCGLFIFVFLWVVVSCLIGRGTMNISIIILSIHGFVTL